MILGIQYRQDPILQNCVTYGLGIAMGLAMESTVYKAIGNWNVDRLKYTYITLLIFGTHTNAEQQIRKMWMATLYFKIQANI